MADYYALLGVAPNATEEEIRRAFREKVAPAQNSTDRTLYGNLNEAFATLKDPQARAEYDLERKKMMNDDSTVAIAPPPSAPLDGNATIALSQTAMGLPVLPCGNATETGAMGAFCVECGLLCGSGECPQTGGSTGVQMPFLKDASGREFRLRVGENTVGREGADVMLPDKSVSRRHAQFIVADGNRVTLEDLGSTNGTRHNGNPLLPGRQAFLSDGDKLRFGSVEVTITIPVAPVKDPKAIGARGPIAALPGSVASAVETPSARLIDANGTIYALKNPTTLGRRAGNDIVLTGDSFLSGNHARIDFADGVFTFTDLGSTNGSKVNGEKMLPHVAQKLEDGDTIQLGNTLLNFHTG